MKVLMISTDRNILEENSAVRARMIEYGALCDELHIIILNQNAKRKTQNNNSKSAYRQTSLPHRQTSFKISENTFVYPTNSILKILMPFDAITIGKKITDINLVTAQDPFETGFAGWRIAHALRARLQLQIHTDFMSPYFARENIKNKIRAWLAKFLLHKADCVRVVSERIKKSIMNITHAPIFVLPIFTDIKKIHDTSIVLDLHIKYPQFEKIILMVSRLEPEKNISLALKVFAEVIKKHPQIGLVIVGDGSQKEKLKFQVSDFKIQDNVMFEGWQNNLAPYYKTTDVFLQTSNYEGYGLSLFEAFTSDLPIVTTDVGIAGDVVSGDGIFICSVCDVSCLTQALEKTLSEKLRFTRNTTTISKEEYLLEYKKQWQMCGH